MEYTLARGQADSGEFLEEPAAMNKQLVLAALAWGLSLTSFAAAVWFTAMKEQATREMSPEARERARGFAWQWELLQGTSYVTDRGRRIQRRLVSATVYSIMAAGLAMLIFVIA